ncbi:hypothetical protein K2173_028177 [Erythroxylum novogranatense]|uniref:Prolamin-like domain-containing protein n=1 Tax=Erythroxylum novogranatense TaxID=1862640 RepID=A0AAV8U3R0_9ROSI|nr:hypothetical protein K2173_028177 [Erythroxylum novogranatense]
MENAVSPFKDKVSKLDPEILENDLSSSSEKTLDDCREGLSFKCVMELLVCFTGTLYPLDECCLEIVENGKLCHNMLAVDTIKRQGKLNPSKFLSRNQQIWKFCAQAVSTTQMAPSAVVF